MAQQVTTDALLLGIFKTWYTEKEFPNLLFRNSPSLREIAKNRIGGRNYNVAALYGRGGNVSGSYTVAVANAASSSANAEFVVVPGNIFAVFNVTQKEILAAQEKRGAYIKTLVNKMFAAMDALRKTFAACWFGFGAGDIGVVESGAAIGAFTMVVPYDTAIKMDVGTQFMVVNGTTPLAAYWDALTRTVTAIDDKTITFDVAVGAAQWTAGSLIEILGGRDATPLPSMPTGLAAWLPSVADRTGATWTTYIGTAFYGVTRSVSVNALAGWFYKRVPGQAKVDALVTGIKLARRGGGLVNMIIVNDDDFGDIIEEVQGQTAMVQMTNTAGAKDAKNEVARGIAKFRYMFSTSWLDKVQDDPYCPKGTAYILDTEVIEFAALSNVEGAIRENVKGNEPGTDSVTSAPEPDTSFRLLIDDYLNIVPNSTSAEGPAAQVSLSIYGNFCVHAPGHNAVVRF
jgi:hypothetical protein